MQRGLGLLAGVAVHVLFALTVWRLFVFLRDGRELRADGSLLINAALAIQFCVPHSVLLNPACRQRLGRMISAPFYGLFFTAVTCLSLLFCFRYWQGAGPVLWDATGAGRRLVWAGFYASWAALFYSLYLTGLGFQTGLTPWLAWVRGQAPPAREFRPRGAYRLLRHPVYLSLLGLLWFAPQMSLDRALLAGVWTAYVMIGSQLKDRRLEFYLGDAYRDYERRVPGYPLVPWGPLGRAQR